MSESENPYQSPTSGAKNNSAVITADTFVRAQKLHFGWWILAGQIITGVFGFGFLVIGVFILFSGGNVAAAMFLLFAGGLLFYKGLFRQRQLARQNKKRFDEMGKERGEKVIYEPSREWLRLITEESDAKLKWKTFFQWKEGDGLILAYRHAKMFQVIPVDQLDDETAATIREHLKNNCKRV